MLPYLKENWLNDKKYIYFKKDGHLNEKGNEMVAKFLVKNLRKIK